MLNYTYNKELYHSLKIKNGLPRARQSAELGDHTIFFPEERLGFIHVYKNQGLYIKYQPNTIQSINSYTREIIGMEDEIFQPKWWHFIYKIPRRW